MKTLLSWLFVITSLLFLASAPAEAQNPPPTAGYVVYQSQVPAGVCNLPNYLTVVTIGNGAGVYQCKGFPTLTWQQVGSISGVSSINTITGAFIFDGAGVSCSTTDSITTCTFTGLGSGIGSITWSLPSWLVASPGTLNASGTQTFSAATGQTSHEVIGTCGTATSFGPCALVAADIPALPYLSNATQLPITIAATSHQFLTSYTSSTGLFTKAQPAFTDLSGALATTQGPTSLTGILYDTAGTLSVATSATIISLWTGSCSSTTFLRGDGACVTPAGGGGTTTNALTMNNSGIGASSGTTFNGSNPTTLSYNTLGAPGLAATTNTFTGTLNDFSGTAQIKLPVVTGYTPAANGELGYDSTNLNWHTWSNGVNDFIAVFSSASPPTTGDCVQFTKSTNSWSLTDAGAACGNTLSTSLTNNVLPKANGAASLINSALSDDGTHLTYAGSGTAAGFTMPEGTALSGVALSDVFWADSTAHRWKFNSNNAGALNLVGIASAGTAAHLVGFASNGIDLVTAAAPLSCQPGLGDGLNAIPAGTYLTTSCKNETGSTWTITAIRCVADAGSSTCAVTNGAGTALLTGAITGTSSYANGTQSGTTTIASGDFLKITYVADGTTKQIGIDVAGTF